MKNSTRLISVLAVSASLISTPLFAAKVKVIHVDLKNGKGEKIGTAKLTAIDEGVKVHLEAAHLTPGKHGIHFHEKGVCEGPDFKSAGGHFNPEHKEHGLENPKGAHAGDMPNVEAGSTGMIRTDWVVKGATLGSGATSLERPEGAALVIHAKADDQHSNPAGEAGDRVACGVIPAENTAAVSAPQNP